MDDKTFAKWMKLIDAGTTEILGDAKFACEVAEIAGDEELRRGWPHYEDVR